MLCDIAAQGWLRRLAGPQLQIWNHEHRGALTTLRVNESTRDSVPGRGLGGGGPAWMGWAEEAMPQRSRGTVCEEGGV